MVYNLTAFVGYRVYRVSYDMAEFASIRQLPTTRELNIRKVIILTSQAILAMGMLVFIIQESFYVFDTPEIEDNEVQLLELISFAC